MVPYNAHQALTTIRHECGTRVSSIQGSMVYVFCGACGARDVSFVAVVLPEEAERRGTKRKENRNYDQWLIGAVKQRGQGVVSRRQTEDACPANGGAASAPYCLYRLAMPDGIRGKFSASMDKGHCDVSD